MVLLVGGTLVISARWWFPPILQWSGANKDSIDAFTKLVQLFLGIISLVLAVLQFRVPLPPPPTVAMGPVISPGASAIGRDHEIDQVYRLLNARTSVVITGIAGVGKSTVMKLAVKGLVDNNALAGVSFHSIAERDSGEERLGRLLVDLITDLDPNAKVESAEAASRFRQAKRLIAGRSILLAIDNANDDESQNVVRNVLENLPTLTLVVGSQQAAWQNLFRVQLKGIPEYEGVKLFEDAYGKELTPKERVLAASLCKHFDGHPVAITLAAGEAAQGRLPLRDLTANLSGILIERDIDQRLARTRERLSEGAQRLLEVIGLLDTATVRIDLLRQVTHVSTEDLEGLQGRYLIQALSGRDRVSVHELIRMWCRRALDDSDGDGAQAGRIEALRSRVADFYREFLSKRRTGTPVELKEIDEEWPNILGLIDGLKGAEQVLALVDETIGDHFDDPNGYVPRRKQMAGLLARSDRLLSLANQAGGVLGARIEKNLGHFYYWRGDYGKAQELFLRSKDHYKKGGDLIGEAATTWLEGYLADDENRYSEAETFYKLGTEIAEQVKPFQPELVAVGHHLVGCTLYHQGRYQDAEAEFRLARNLINPETAAHLIARIDRRLGSVALELGRIEEAEKTFDEVARLVDQIQRPRDGARIARHVGILHLLRGELNKAEEFLNGALRTFEELEGQRGIGYTLHGFARLRSKQGRLQEARDMCERSLKIATQQRSLYGEAAGYELMADILEAEGHPPPVVYRNRQRATNLYEMIGHRRADTLRKLLENSGAIQSHLPTNIRGVLFDLMDTLAHLPAEVYAKTHDLLTDYLGVSPERFKWAWAASRELASTGALKSTLERIEWVASALGIGATDQTRLLDAVKEEEAMWRDNVKFYDGAVPLLRSLREAKLRIAIVSNGPVAMTSLNDALGLSSLVDAFILSCQVGMTKPDPAIYSKALETLTLDPGQCVFIGDGNDRELDGARKAGIYSIKIKQFKSPFADLKNQSLDWDFQVENLEGISSLLSAAAEQQKTV